MFSLILVHIGGSPINPRCHVFVDFNESQFGVEYNIHRGGRGEVGVLAFGGDIIHCHQKPFILAPLVLNTPYKECKCHLSH